MLVLAQMSDLHIDGTQARLDRARRVLDYLNGFPQPVDILLVTGDIADGGKPAEYAAVRELLETSKAPVMLCPGNHDHRQTFREVLLDDEPDCGPINDAHTVGGALLLVCDSSVPGRSDGLLDDDTLEWLTDRLAETPADRPVLLVFHHPPAELGCLDSIDGYRQFGEARLAQLIDTYPNIAALISGHAHTAAATSFAGRPLVSCPSTASLMLLPCESDEVINESAPPGFALHLLDDTGRLTTHFRTVPL